ncbi:hypothetical protein EWM64_g841 [Hericium alpestre]|uniref:Tcp11-domain-containing protein n=1 Tax=Hericium alpestre TaxID=135208 RepID=A0A4Z0AB08_9AGAM|nr:hypothetical protein EWM64_g841 [Hericium alpestre]
MDDLAHHSRPLSTLSRKRKADSQDCDCTVADPVSSPEPTQRDLQSPLPSRLTVPCAAPPTHRLSLETASNTAQGTWFTSRPASDTPLPSPSSPSAMSPCIPEPTADPDTPSRAKRPRIDAAKASSKTSKRAAVKRAQQLITALQASAGSWHWETSSSGDTRLVAPVPAGAALEQTDNSDFSLSASLSPGGLSPSASRVVIPIDPCSPHIPIRHPPINKETLKELDLDAIMRNPQLRHDFLFDSGLQFRAAASRRKREQAETYWSAVLRELELGCTCVTFDTRGRPHNLLCVCQRLPEAPSEPVIACMPLRRKLTLRMPSRLRPLLQELLQVLLSIIRPQASVLPNTQGGNVSFQQRVRQHMEQSQRLQAVLDADLIEQEMKHGVYDLSSSFGVIGEVLKSHCAPMRDAAVDAMVDLANKCAPGGEGTKADAVQAMRSCFEILELMKLDIANHQMQTLRPYIIHSSPDFELQTFKERHPAQQPFDITDQWLLAAHQRLEASNYTLTYPTRSFTFRTLCKRTRVILSSLRAIIDLIFTPPSTTLSEQATPSRLPGYPETLYLDHSRFALLAKDVADLSAIYMLLMLHRQLLYTSTPSGHKATGDASVLEAHLQNLKKEMWDLGPSNIGRCFLPKGMDGHPERSHRSSQNDEEHWTSGIKAVVLQVTRRATEARRPLTRNTTPIQNSASTAVQPPDEHLLKLAESWADRHLRLDSPLSTLMRERLCNTVFDLVVSTVVIRGNLTPASVALSASVALPEEQRGGVAGLEPLSAEVRQLAERLAKLSVLHLNVYQALYEQSPAIPDW